MGLFDCNSCSREFTCGFSADIIFDDVLTDENYICYFELADKFKHFDKVIKVIENYTEEIISHFEATHIIFTYNIEWLWNWSSANKKILDVLKVYPSSSLYKIAKSRLSGEGHDIYLQEGLFKLLSCEYGDDEAIRRINNETFNKEHQMSYKQFLTDEAHNGLDNFSLVSWESIFYNMNKKHKLKIFSC